MSTFKEFYEALEGNPPPSNVDDRLRKYWEQPVSALCTLADPVALDEPTCERHRLYAQGLMAIVWHHWCGNKRGRRGDYPWNAVRTDEDPEWLDGDYRGHNIAAVAVDGRGEMLDFEFNHNELFRSSAEHAEIRLVRRLFKRVRLKEMPGPPAFGGAVRSSADYPSLDQVSIYTSLESCSQCSGVMALARVKEVIYLQTDPGAYFIGRILRNLTAEDLRAPLPIGGGEIGLPEFEELDAAFDLFQKRLTEKPFWSGGDREDRRPSLTSFLCTATARDIFARGSDPIRAPEKHPDMVRHPTHRPSPTALTNLQVLGEVAAFVQAVITRGFHGTPHS